jgi:large subunit ribosomal protein L15
MAEKKDTKKPSSAKTAAVKPADRKGTVKSAGKTGKAAAKTAGARPARKADRPAARARKEKPEAAAVAASTGTSAAPAPAAAFAGIHDLRPSPGATHSRKRVGRGPGSGHGKTAGRGNKGQKSRTGYRHMRGFEGGQMPLHRRVPKRGFTNIFRVEYDIVNISDLDRFEAGAAVTPEVLAGERLARASRPVKILGGGEIAKPLTVSAHKFSAGARARIEAAGGRCEVIPR